MERNGKITLYHGSTSSDDVLCPEYGRGREDHDYGKGLYLTDRFDLAKEWSVCSRPKDGGKVYKLDVHLDELNIFSFNDEEESGTLAWVAELLHNKYMGILDEFYTQKRQFVDRYRKDLSGFDVIYGWRADGSFNLIIDAFISNMIDLPSLNNLLHIGDWGYQYCIKSKRAFGCLDSVYKPMCIVPVDYVSRYDKRNSEMYREYINIVSGCKCDRDKLFSSYIV